MQMTFPRILINSLLISIVIYLAVTGLMVLALAVTLPERGNLPLGQEFYASVIGVFSWQAQRFFLAAGLIFGVTFFIAESAQYLFKAFGYDFAAFVSNLSLKHLGRA